MSKIFRVAIIAVIIMTFLNALVFIGLGIYRSLHAYLLIIESGLQDKPGIHIVDSIDNFLIAFVFIILSLGFMKLFIPDFNMFKGIELPWMKINDFAQLKMLLWSTVLLTLVILFATIIINAEGRYEWTMLVLPGSVLMLSLAAKFLPH